MAREMNNRQKNRKINDRKVVGRQAGKEKET